MITILNGGYTSFSSDTLDGIHYYIQDYMGNNRMVVNGQTGAIEQVTHYYPYGGVIGDISYTDTLITNDYKFEGKELDRTFGLDWYDIHARQYDAIGVPGWNKPDQLAEKYYGISPYSYCAGNPVNCVDLDGNDTIIVSDQSCRPQDNGIAGTSYTATVSVIQNGILVGSYRGSSYPNSQSNTDNSTPYNTIIGNRKFDYNNSFGHKGGTQKGLNIVDDTGNRQCEGIAPDGSKTTMENVNIHAGASDKGNFNSRGSHGCITIHPDDASDFFANFEWNNTNTNTGTSTGSLFVVRNSIINNQGTNINQNNNEKIDFYINIINGIK